MDHEVIDADGGADLVEPSTFFAPAPTDAIESLLAEHRALRREIELMAAFQRGPKAQAVLSYFLEGNATRERGELSMESARRQLFEEAGAVAALDASFWSKALALTDVLDLMPQSRRSEWQTQVKDHKCPPFEGDSVRATLLDLLGKRLQFFGERVDGIFRGLSGEHLTNAPEGFGKRMIVSGVLSYYDTVDHERAGLIGDLRCVIARFMGRDEPEWWATRPLIERLRGRWGEWVRVDGGALRIRLYRKGTAHLEVHPEMAWRLNAVLASLYPLAIPPEFRARPAKRAKKVEVIQRPLPFRVLEVLATFTQAYDFEDAILRSTRVPVPNTVQPDRGLGHQSKDVLKEVHQVLESIGGVPIERERWRFPYNPSEVLATIVVSGCLPDSTSHQFFPTPEALASVCARLARVGPGDTVLEPSAGQGALLRFVPTEQCMCVEISPLHAAILKAKGLQVEQADFLEWAEACRERYSRIVMNPPFADGRALAHLKAAVSVMAPGGRLVAILPASLRGQDLTPGLRHWWTAVYENQFPGTSARVAILVVQDEAAGDLAGCLDGGS